MNHNQEKQSPSTLYSAYFIYRGLQSRVAPFHEQKAQKSYSN